MPYVQAIVLESLRMFMGRTLNVPHRALKDTSIVGHKIPKVITKYENIKSLDERFNTLCKLIKVKINNYYLF